MSSENPLELEQLYTAADSVAAHYDNDTYLYSGPLNGVGFAKIIAAVLEQPQRSNCLLILTTNGGNPVIAYQIARFLHRKYAKLFVCTPGFCKNAGTLIALGAHTILADEYTEFGPINGIVDNRDIDVDNELGAMETFEFGLDYSLDIFERALQRIRRVTKGNIHIDVASELSLFLAYNIMQPCFSEFNLTEAGKEMKSLSVALAYGRRLASHGQNVRGDAVEKLVKGYPSQEFIIDYTEAEELFTSIEKPVMALYQLLGCLGDPVYSQQQIALVRRVKRPQFPSNSNGSESASSAEKSHRLGRQPVDVAPETAQRGRDRGDAQAQRKKKA